jgi:hypothetical protein
VVGVVYCSRADRDSLFTRHDPFESFKIKHWEVDVVNCGVKAICGVGSPFVPSFEEGLKGAQLSEELALHEFVPSSLIIKMRLSI